MTADRQNELALFYRTALLEDCVPFWFPRSVDAEHGGFFSALDRDGTVVDTDKSVWAQGRMTWMLLSLYNTVEKRPEWLAWGKSGLEFLNQHCFDADGRMFFHVTREGRPIRKRRYAFSECFAAIAHAAYARATGDERAAVRARELLDLFTRWNFIPGLMPPKFTDTRPMIGISPHIMTIATAQELRENLGDDPGLTAWIDRSIEEIRRLFVKPDLRVVMETVGSNGEVLDHFDGRALNPGHAIECAWFILREGRRRGDARLIGLGCYMLDWMWERGWDAEHGGIFYFRDVFGKPVAEYWQDMKFWWPHNEAIVATLLAWQLTGEARYGNWHKAVHDWSFNQFADSHHGEWFGYLHRDGSLAIPLKGNLWKSFFHLPRMEWYCWKLLEQSPAKTSDEIKT